MKLQVSDWHDDLPARHKRTDILMDVHQCVRFSTNLKLIHERVATRIGRYLIDTIEKI